MSAIQQAFVRFAPEYLARFGSTMPAGHRKVIRAIVDCRSPALGQVCFACKTCGCAHVSPASCGNRHCPQCQGRKSMQWLAKQAERQLPGRHFLLTFTVPQALRSFLRSQQTVGYRALFAASAAAIKIIARNPRHIGADACGFFGVLHTWGRQLQYHPHIHYVVPAGAMRTKDRRWMPSRDEFFLPVKALSRLFRTQFKADIKSAGLLAHISSSVWGQQWVVHCESIPNAKACIEYLAPYVFKVAISDQRILRVDDTGVRLRWRKVGSNRPRTLTLDGIEFLRRFLNHVLPKGFIKVRHYGFMSANSAISRDEVQLAIVGAHAFEIPRVPKPQAPKPPPTCRSCGGTLRFAAMLRPAGYGTRTTGPPAIPI